MVPRFKHKILMHKNFYISNVRRKVLIEFSALEIRLGCRFLLYVLSKALRRWKQFFMKNGRSNKIRYNIIIYKKWRWKILQHHLRTKFSSSFFDYPFLQLHQRRTNWSSYVCDLVLTFLPSFILHSLKARYKNDDC